MKVIYSLLLATVLLCACNNQATEKKNKNIFTKKQKSIDSSWIFDSVSGKKLIFKNGKEFSTDIYELKYIGQLPNGSNAPFLIFSGRDCTECDAPISIFIHSPANGKLVSEGGQNQYSYPGIESDYETNEPAFKARAFYGEVLPGIKGVVWYQELLMENHTWQKEVFLVELSNGKKTETHLKINTDIKETLKLLNSNLCKEIEGVNYASQP